MRIFQRTSIGGAIVVALCLFAFFVKTAQAESAQWHSTIEEASAEARKSNKPMMLDFWAGWCEACKVMDDNVYTDDRFVNTIPQFLAVRIDFDKKQAIARKYNVVALPTIVFTDSYGTELFRYSGFIGAKSLVELMQSLPADVSEFNRLARILSQDKKNFEALVSMGKELRSAELYLASNDYFQKALERNETKLDPAERQTIMVQVGLNSLDVKDGKRASEMFEKCLKEFPNSQDKSQWILELAQAYNMDRKTEKARKLLQEFIAEHPGSADAEKAQSLLN